MRFSILASSVLVALAQAVTFTTPPKGTTFDLSKGPFDITWSTVNTDPSSAHLLLVRQAGGPQYSYDFGVVQLSDGKYTISKLDLPDGDTYQFSLESRVPNNQGILARTEQFNIIGKASGATLTLPAAGSGAASTSAGAASSTSGSSSGSSSGSGSGSGSGSSGSSVTTSTTLTTSTGTVTSGSSTTSSGAVATASHNEANANAIGSSMFALLIGAAAAMI